MPRPASGTPLPTTPYEDRLEWDQMWEACVAVLDRYPHVRLPAPPWPPVSRRVRIPQSAVDAADVHFHLD